MGRLPAQDACVSGTAARATLGGDFATAITPARIGAEPARFLVLREAGVPAARALLVWGQCAGEECPPPRRDTVLGALRCRPDAIFRGDPVKVICHVGGYYLLGPGRREPLQSDCYYFWRGETSGGPWQVLAVPDAEFCEE